ncbi:MAG: hypothetical protein PVI71_14510 [Desulfobacterales bacterium]
MKFSYIVAILISFFSVAATAQPPIRAELQRGRLEFMDIIDYMCAKQAWKEVASTAPEVRAAAFDVCKNGRLYLEDTSPVDCLREAENCHFSVNVTAGPLVLKETIAVTATIGTRTIQMVGSGDGEWQAELSTWSLVCSSSFEVVFRATATAKSDHADLYFPKSIMVRKTKYMYGPGKLLMLPAPYYNGITYLQGYGHHNGYEITDFRIGNYMGPGEEITVNGHDVYCVGTDGIWAPCGTDGIWKIFDFQRLQNPVTLQCEEGANLGLAFELGRYYIDGLLIIHTDRGDIFIRIQASQPVSG